MNAEHQDIKATRLLLRQIQADVSAAHEALGALRESAGMVDVVYHPQHDTPELNYVTPRRGTAWVSGAFVAQGLERLQALGRAPRVCYLDGLIPPPFDATLAGLGLARLSAPPLWVWSGSALAPPLVDRGRVAVWECADQQHYTLHLEPFNAPGAFDLACADGLARVRMTDGVAHVIRVAARDGAGLAAVMAQVAQRVGATLVYGAGAADVNAPEGFRVIERAVSYGVMHDGVAGVVLSA